MPILPFNKVRTEDDNLRRVQDNIEAPLKDISSKTILDGQLLTGIKLTASLPNQVAHKLGRKPVGWIVSGLTENATIWEVKKPSSLFLYLEPSADCTLSLWVF